MGEGKEEEKMEKTRGWGKGSRTKGQQDTRQRAGWKQRNGKKTDSVIFVAQFDMDFRSKHAYAKTVLCVSNLVCKVNTDFLKLVI